MTRRQDWISPAAEQLGTAGVPDPVRDARLLLRWVLGVSAEQFSGALIEPGTDVESAAFTRAIARRAGREPLSHITGERLFWGRSFAVGPDVLDPRPETETLIAEALRRCRPRRVLDLGTGSGCILISLLAEWPDAEGVGVDFSEAALRVADRNAEAIGVNDRLHLTRSNWLDEVDGSFDLIVSNPPYIAEHERGDLSPEVLDHEPGMALFAGEDGLTAYREIAARADRVLAPDGCLMLEIGASQAESVSTILREAGWRVDGVVPDLDERPRVIIASK